MYHSPVPLLIIRTDVPSLIQVNGQLVGACDAHSHVALPTGSAGDYYVCASPLSGSGWAVTRLLRFDDGALQNDLPPDASICVWPGGVYELQLATGRAEECGDSLPRTLDHLEFAGKSLTLYAENGLRLAVEENSRPLYGLSLGEGGCGSLTLYRAAGKQYVAALTTYPGGERLTLLDGELTAALEVSSGRVLLQQDGVHAIERLQTLVGHESRVRYLPEKNSSGVVFVPQPPERGFFTHSYERPTHPLTVATAFCEAVREGFDAEARAYLADDLRALFNLEEISHFLGNFQVCRPPLSDESGALLGLIAEEPDRGRLLSARLFAFEFANGLITDISEA